MSLVGVMHWWQLCGPILNHITIQQLLICCDLCFAVHSHVGSKKRQSNEENEYEETPQEKKLRLAKLYLEQLKEEGKLVLSITFGHRGLNITLSERIVCIYCMIWSEEQKAEDDSFETDLIAGRLQEEVVRVSYVLMGVIVIGDIDTHKKGSQVHFLFWNI